MSYKIAFLNDEEFEKLPGKNMEDKIGVAYPKYGEAYVRKTGSNLVDVFTLAHELEHLQGETHDEHFDAENGCYYKKGFLGTFMKSVLPMVGSMFGGPIGGVAGTAASGLMGGNKQQQQQSQQQGVMGAFPQMQQSQPNVIQAAGMSGSGAEGGTPSMGGGVAGMQQSMQSQNTPQQAFGNYNGKNGWDSSNPEWYRANSDTFGTPVGGAA